MARDRIDELKSRLETAFPGFAFDRDALEIGGDEDTGAVEVTGIEGIQTADGKPVGITWGIDIWMATESSGLEMIQTMEDVLNAYDDEVATILWRLPKRSYLVDIGRVAWQWHVTMYGDPGAETETETETEGDGNG